MSRITHAAQIDLRFSDPARAFLDSGAQPISEVGEITIALGRAQTSILNFLKKKDPRGGGVSELSGTTRLYPTYISIICEADRNLINQHP